MKRVLAILCALVAAGGFVVLAGGASNGADANTYKVELDNAFGLVEGGDFKVAGVRAGKVTAMDLDRRTNHTIVTFKITQDGFGSLRTDASCAVQPQSLIGEYYVDCQPGRSARHLRLGATIPVSHTQGTIPPDLVNNIMRRPYRERLSIIIGELGAAVAGNAQNLQDALRRANPALRETNKVLALLARQNQVLADLTRDADRVVGDLAENRTDVGRFVTEARDTAQASAERSTDIARGFERLPTFLRELRPTMTELGRTVDEQGPALRNVSASAGQLDRLLRDIPPFAKASQPAIDALGETSKVGRQAVRQATPTVAALQRYSAGTPELGKNLAIILEHLDDRSHSAELDPRSPGGQGYTGLEALLSYVYDQTLSTNVHDGTVHILKAQPFAGECAAYADIKAAKELGPKCSTLLGPNAVGLNFPDATAPKGFDGNDHTNEPPASSGSGPSIPALRTGPGDGRDAPQRSAGDAAGAAAQRQGQAPAAPDGSRSSGAPAVPKAPGLPSAPAVPDLDPLLPATAAPKSGDADQAQAQLLDYLLGR